MRHATFDSAFVLATPMDEVWAFHADPARLATVMPGLPRVRVSRFDAPLRVGSAIHLELALGPIRQPWELTVIAVEAGRQFVDQQTGRGPMAYWRHSHAFEAAGAGTRVIDHIDYALPLGGLGRLAAALFGGLAMRMLFAVRRRKTAAWFA
ncbi:MAG: SRPBCC family protein [Thermoflexales bacterium]|nr:SRPBCC family protein [Thermoflexales bacterium]MBP8242718.1 SRPBCC family protein [Thermoflexales bacterium]